MTATEKIKERIRMAIKAYYEKQRKHGHPKEKCGLGGCDYPNGKCPGVLR